jgi:hypothetical protein
MGLSSFFSPPISAGLAVPVYFLNVVIHLYRQLGSTSRAPSFENLASFGRSHTRAEAMPAQPAADFRLVGSFWHSTLHRFLNLVAVSLILNSFILPQSAQSNRCGRINVTSDYTAWGGFGQLIARKKGLVRWPSDQPGLHASFPASCSPRSCLVLWLPGKRAKRQHTDE